MCRDGALGPAMQVVALVATWLCRCLGDALRRSSIEPQRLRLPVYAMVGHARDAACGYRRRCRADDLSPDTGAPTLRSRDRTIFWHGKISDRQNGRSRDPSFARRDVRFLVPPRRAGMEPVDGLTWWLWRTRPTSGLGCFRQRWYQSLHGHPGHTTPRCPCGGAGADELVEFGREG